MKFTLLVTTSPASSQGAITAYRFAKEAVSQGHEIYRVFFYGDGVLNANALSVVPQDEMNLPRAWEEFLTNYDIDSVACVSSALVRGILNSNESTRQKFAGVSLNESTQIAGLGQLVDATLHSERLISFV